VRLGSRKKQPRTNQKNKIQGSTAKREEIDCDQPHLMPNKKTEPIQWTEQPTGAWVATGSLWPSGTT
jgi:hypothetical protein